MATPSFLWGLIYRFPLQNWISLYLFLKTTRRFPSQIYSQVITHTEYSSEAVHLSKPSLLQDRILDFHANSINFYH